MLVLSVLLTALVAGPTDETGPKTLYRPEMFETLVNPDCSHCVDEARRKAGVLRDDDRVLAWIRGEYNGGAIPYRWFLVPYRVISDSYGVFVYDADADFVRGWPASYDFRFHGWRNGVMVMRHEDGTLFDCLTGLAFEGPRKGERLRPLPLGHHRNRAVLRDRDARVRRHGHRAIVAEHELAAIGLQQPERIDVQARAAVSYTHLTLPTN